MVVLIFRLKVELLGGVQKISQEDASLCFACLHHAENSVLSAECGCRGSFGKLVFNAQFVRRPSTL